MSSRPVRRPSLDDPEAFARTAVADKGGLRCSMCSNPRVRAAVAKWSKMWNDGTTAMSYEQGAWFLGKHYGFSICATALRRCAIQHHGRRPRA